MDHNLKKEEKQIIALIIGFITVIIFGLMAMFISQFGGLEALTPVHFAHVRYVYKVDGKDYYHDIVKEVERWETQITVWYDKNHPKRHVTSEYSESKRIYYGWVFTIVLTLAAFLSGFSS